MRFCAQDQVDAVAAQKFERFDDLRGCETGKLVHDDEGGHPVVLRPLLGDFNKFLKTDRAQEIGGRLVDATTRVRIDQQDAAG
jgi:hypothetical protein